MRYSGRSQRCCGSRLSARRLNNMTQILPSLVILGRPNVGKSTLFNRLTGTRRSIVTNEPGITRDRIYGKAEWRGKALEIVDTGGIVPDDKALIPTEILRQAHVAIKKAALLVLVVDSQAGVTPLDQELARLIRTTGKPFVVAVNKVDAVSQEVNAAVFHSLGVPVFPIAAEHGTGVDDLLDAALAEVDAFESEEEVAKEDAVEVAIIGRPNVGKSTLLNRMAGEDRSIVSPIPGTTMDNVDTEVVHEGKTYRFVHHFRIHVVHRGYGSGARGKDVPVRGYGGDSAQGQDDFGSGKIECGDGAA